MREETIIQLKNISVPKHYAEEEYICFEGQPGNEMYIILKGSVGVFITSVIGTLNQVATIGVGDFFGEMAIFDDLPRSASCIALADTIVVAINKDNLQEFLATCPDIAKQILENMSGRIRRLDAELYQNNRFVKNRYVPRFEIPTVYKTGHIMKAPNQMAELVKEYKQKCPICGKAIPVKDLKRNIIEERMFDNDCRIHYFNCDPLWTEVISCPTCYYTNHYLKFFGINNFEYELIEKLLRTEHKPILEARLEKRGDYDMLVIKYLQAININEHINPGANLLIGGLWRNLYWLAKDMDEQEFAKYCGIKAIEKYKTAIDENEFNDNDSRAVIALSLTSIMIYCKDYKDILRYVSIATESSVDKIKARALKVKSMLDFVKTN